MADTVRTLAALQALLADNVAAAISPQDLRDFLVSAVPSGRSATKVVASNDASDLAKAQADYVCDGTADDEEIQAAIDALPAGGGKVVLSEGIFVIAAAIDVPLNVVLEGQGMYGADATDGTVLKRNATGYVLIDMIGTDRTTGRVGRGQIRDLSLDGNDLAGVGIDCKYADGVGLYRVNFYRIPDSAIQIEECWDWRVNDCEFHNCGASGTTKATVRIFNGADDNSNVIRFWGCRWETTNWISVEVDSSGAGNDCHNIDFLNCKFHGRTSSQGICAHVEGKLQNCKFIGCKFSNPGQEHIKNVGGAGMSITSGSVFEGGTSDGTEPMVYSDTAFTMISSSHFSTTPHATYHINLASGADYCTVLGNTAWDSGTTKQLVNNNGANNIIKDNNPDIYVSDTDAEAIPVDASQSIALGTGGAETRTLAAPLSAGQELLLYFKTDGGNCVVTCATTINEAGNNTILFNAAGESLFLRAVEEGSNLRWRCAVADGATLSTV